MTFHSELESISNDIERAKLEYGLHLQEAGDLKAIIADLEAIRAQLRSSGGKIADLRACLEECRAEEDASW